MDSLEIILSRDTSGRVFSSEEKQRLAKEKNELYTDYFETLTPHDVEQSVLRMLELLKEKGYLLAIGSSSKNAGFILKGIGLLGLFATVSDGNNITKSKPHKVFLKTAEYFSLPPCVCVVGEGR